MSESKNSSVASLPVWAFVHKPAATGQIKVAPEDFKVEELLGFELDGAGEHVWLFIEKTGFNTQDIVNLLAKAFNLQAKYISYAGLKDKHAITRQWFSVWSAKEIDVSTLSLAGVNVLELKRHRSKLRRGAHQANQFELTLKEITNSQALKEGLDRVQRDGVPNYFGLQRFGRAAKNIDKARAMFAGELKARRHERGLYLSAARSYLFNEVLSRRVEARNWDTGLAGDAMMLAGSNSFFSTAEIDGTLVKRLAHYDIHPSAPLWGKGKLTSSLAALALESEVGMQFPELLEGLTRFGLRQQRRSMRLMLENFSYEWQGVEQLKLSFSLSKGAFATTVLRELITIEP